MKNLPGILTIAGSFIWMGLLIGISFIEAPLKFQAPGVTTLIGVGIGNLVFHALNKIELILFLILLACWLFFPKKKAGLILMLLIGLVLSLQMGWLMPSLDARIILIQKGIQPPESSLHVYYVMGEAMKIILLFMTGTTMIYKQETKRPVPVYRAKAKGD